MWISYLNFGPYNRNDSLLKQLCDFLFFTAYIMPPILIIFFEMNATQLRCER